MKMVIPDEGKQQLLNWMIHNDGSGFSNMRLFLFINDYIPVDASTLADFDEATFVGSDAIDITRLEMGTYSMVSHVAYYGLATAPGWTCTGGGPETCYGWVLFDLANSVVLAAQRFDVPRVMDTGATETLDPFRIGLKTMT